MPIIDRFNSKWTPEPFSGCWLWTGALDRWGYGAMKVDFTVGRAHRVAWNLLRGDIPEGLFVLHKCDTPSCVNPDHLFLGTTRDNVRDKVLKHRQSKGNDFPFAKLTDQDVLYILSSDESCIQLAERFSVNRETIRLIKIRKNWKHISLKRDQREQI
jgi:hypothetical protein